MTAEQDLPRARDERFAYVLLCHVDEDAVLRTARRIRELSPGAHVLLRHSRGEQFLAEEAAAGAGAEVLRSEIGIRWGTWSTVAAVLEALADAEGRWQPSYTVVLSGQDYPVRDLVAWERSVRGSGADALLHPEQGCHEGRHAVCWHALPAARWVPVPLLAALAHVGNRIVHRVPWLPRAHHAGERTWMLAHPRWRRRRPPVPYRKGSLWMTLSHRGVAALLRAGVHGSAGARFFASTLLPDESFAHSVLGAAADVRVRAGVTTVAFFGEQDGHARVLGEGDLAQVLATGAAFARKVLPGVGDGFVSAADERLAAAARSAPVESVAGPGPGPVLEPAAPVESIASAGPLPREPALG
ncbi:hypothetical protein [Kineococcus sp. SYSU DK005]|uniref:hypothetical protein n=1 Tax=Kineococcus sp. SYSU DK005 TaxID=3383126 RepID=UPI003D7D08AE